MVEWKLSLPNSPGGRVYTFRRRSGPASTLSRQAELVARDLAVMLATQRPRGESGHTDSLWILARCPERAAAFLIEAECTWRPVSSAE